MASILAACSVALAVDATAFRHWLWQDWNGTPRIVWISIPVGILGVLMFATGIYQSGLIHYFIHYLTGESHWGLGHDEIVSRVQDIATSRIWVFDCFQLLIPRDGNWLGSALWILGFCLASFSWAIIQAYLAGWRGPDRPSETGLGQG